MSKSKQIHWVLEDHICSRCSGRILRAVSGVGATGGGNPLYRCADCGAGATGMGPSVLCWCGFNFKRNDIDTNPYCCRKLTDAKDDPVLRQCFLACGFDPERPKSEIGVYMPEHYKDRFNLHYQQETKTE